MQKIAVFLIALLFVTVSFGMGPAPSLISKCKLAASTCNMMVTSGNYPDYSQCSHMCLTACSTDEGKDAVSDTLVNEQTCANKSAEGCYYCMQGNVSEIYNRYGYGYVQEYDYSKDPGFFLVFLVVAFFGTASFAFHRFVNRRGFPEFFDKIEPVFMIIILLAFVMMFFAHVLGPILAILAMGYVVLRTTKELNEKKKTNAIFMIGGLLLFLSSITIMWARSTWNLYFFSFLDWASIIAMLWPLFIFVTQFNMKVTDLHNRNKWWLRILDLAMVVAVLYMIWYVFFFFLMVN